MEKERNIEWDKCEYWLYLDECRDCLFEDLCFNNLSRKEENILDQNNKKDEKRENSMWGIH